MAATTLPKFFVLQQPGAPLAPWVCPIEAAANEPSYVLKFDENQIFSPRVKFATEQSQTGDATLVHIRSCYNNKYWVPVYQADRPDGQQLRIAASAEQPEEDRSNPACTLFRVSPGLKLQYIGRPSDGYVGVDENRTLVLKSTTTTFSTVVDWEKLVILPSQVTFKSEQYGGIYLYSSSDVLGRKTHYFGYNLELDDPRVAFQLFPTHRGYYRIKTLDVGKFWRRDEYSTMILADAEDDNSTDHTTFECIKIQDNLIALRNSFNNGFCGDSPLTAVFQTLSKETRLIIEERVKRREIAIREYYLPRSRIYGGQVLALAEQTIQNRSPVADVEQYLKFSETIASTASWNNTVSVNGSVSYEFKVTIIPLIAEAKVSLSVTAGFDHQWGASETKTTTIESDTKVVVPPLTNMKVSLLCTKATCDVPFSYTETDLLPSGASVSTVKDDGVFIGANAYEFRIRSAEVDENGQELRLLKLEPASVTYKLDG